MHWFVQNMMFSWKIPTWFSSWASDGTEKQREPDPEFSLFKPLSSVLHEEDFNWSYGANKQSQPLIPEFVNIQWLKWRMIKTDFLIYWVTSLHGDRTRHERQHTQDQLFMRFQQRKYSSLHWQDKYLPLTILQ